MNIMINNYCNLKCEYCFASQLMKEHYENMSLEDFIFILDNYLQDEQQIRIIGGEPTRHPQFKEFVDEIIKRKKKEIMIFTNGTFDDNLCDYFLDIARKTHLRFLINYNQPKIIGEKMTSQLEKNISRLAKYCMVTLGINIYDTKQDYEYVIVSSVKWGLKDIRYSVCVPNDEVKASNPKEYFKSFVPMVVNLISKAYIVGVTCHVDCNNIPICLIDDQSLRFLAIVDNELLKKNLCSPVLDVSPTLKVSRCFGCSNKQVNLKDFKSIKELGDYFEAIIDTRKKYIDLLPDCVNCASKLINGKSCGCLAYKKDVN